MTVMDLKEMLCLISLIFIDASFEKKSKQVRV